MGAKQWIMIVDVARCEACYNCFLAVKDEHIGNEFPGYSAPQPLHGHNWLDIQRNERGIAPMVDAHSMPVMCNQCDNAPCIRAAKNGAMYKRPDGIVMIDPDKAKGQRQLVSACPYGHIHWNEELQLPQKWNFDAHLLDSGWTRTRAEQVCATGALKSMKIDEAELATLQQDGQLAVLEPQFNTRPRVFYKNLHLMTKAFIAGTVISRSSGIEECLSGVTVLLLKSGQVKATAITDTFGEFKFDGLDPDSGEYEVRVGDMAEPKCRTRLQGVSVYVGVLEGAI